MHCQFETEKLTANGAVTSNKTYNYDALNRLQSVIDSVDSHTVLYEYDANGNTIKKNDNALPLDYAESLFDYDALNRLVQTKKAGLIMGQYDYDDSNLRIRHRYSERGDVEYYHDGRSVIEERNAQDNSFMARYSYADKLLSMQTPNGSQYYHHDALGSTVNLTDQNGATQVSYFINPWGLILRQIGASENRKVFTGKEVDERTGLVYFGARYYDPDTARFINQDSYLGKQDTPPSLHRYLYAYSNPTVFIDLEGYAAEKSVFDKISDGIQENIIAPLDKEVDELSKKFKKEGVKFENSLKSTIHAGTKAVAKSVKGTVEAIGTAVDLYATSDPANGLFEEGEESRARVRQVAKHVGTAIKNAPAKIVKTIEDREGKLKELRAYLDKSFVQGDPKDTYEVATGLAGLVLSTRGPGELGGAGKALSTEIRIAEEIEGVATKRGIYSIGDYDALRKTAEAGLDAHHAGQKAFMKNLVEGYNELTAPSILVPKVGHTIKDPVRGIVSRTGDFKSARDLLARDIKELRRVYPDIPNSSLIELIDMNKNMYKEIRIKQIK